jgi:hypothetical protein
MIATQMTTEQVKDYLRDVMPWLATDTNATLLSQSGCTIENIASEIARKESSLIIAQEYHHGWREHLSIYLDAEDGYAFRKAFFEKKKVADEARELAQFRKDLKGFHIVTNLGERINVEALTLPQLRKHVATIAENRRQRTLSPEQLRAEERAKNPPPQRRTDGYPIMPKMMVVPAGIRVGDKISDGIHATEMSPEIIIGLGRAPGSSVEYHFYKFRLFRAYGGQQLNERSAQGQ